MSTDTLFDPLRKKEIAATPEEKVRQWFIQRLSEVGMKYGAKTYRADILAYDRSGAPLLVVECKRPDVQLSEETARQAMRYNMVLGVRWLMLTNGARVLVFHREGDTFLPQGQIPNYEQMLCRQ